MPSRLIVAGLTLGMASSPLAADPPPLTLDTITVTATRTERALRDVAGSVTVIDETRIEREQAQDIRDLVRYEPGVSVDAAGDRFGLSGFRIRGIGGDRVLTLVDGVRIADEFAFGPFQDANRDFVDVDALKRVEIVRGPASALYGSDALGGVVHLLTKDPADYPGLFNEHHYLSGKLGYSGANDSLTATATAVGQQGDWSALLLYSHRDGHETESFGGRGGDGPERQQANPQDFTNDSLLAKLVFEPDDKHRFRLTLDGLRGDTDTEVRSDYATVVRGTTIDRRDGRDERERQRLTLDYRYRGATTLFDQAQVQLYQQDSSTDQFTTEQQTAADGTRTRRTRDSFFDQRLRGASMQFDKTLQAGAVRHTLSYGAEVYTVDSDNRRDGSTTDLASGAPLPESQPFPTRAFPLSETLQYALYLQDEIRFGAWTLIPALRYDAYQLDVENDPVYQDGNPGNPPPEDFDDARLSPRLGLVYRLDDTVSLFAQYAEGFRAPPYDDINVGFTNLAGGYKSVPNPDLKPETSRGYEIGLRAESAAGNLSLAVFRNDYEDFIESLAPQGIDPADGLLVFQSENRGKVRIQGVEAAGEWYPDSLWPAAEGWRIKASLAYARGDDRETDQPLNSVDPARLVLGLAYDEERWGTELAWTLSAAKTRVDAGDTGQFETPGYGVVDLFGYYQINKHARFNWGVFNLTDKKYWQWGETVLGRPGDDPALDRFTQPGRHVALSFRAEW